VIGKFNISEIAIYFFAIEVSSDGSFGAGDFGGAESLAPDVKKLTKGEILLAGTLDVDDAGIVMGVQPHEARSGGDESPGVGLRIGDANAGGDLFALAVG